MGRLLPGEFSVAETHGILLRPQNHTHLTSKGLGWEFAAWLSIHGTTELFAILLGGAAGIHVGRAMAFPGDRAILAAASDAGRRAAQVMAGAVLMLVCAGLLEGYARQLVVAPLARASIGGAMLLFWLSYFLLMRGRPQASER